MTWPEERQHEFLTHEGAHSVYGMNAVYQDGHHGNAVVSRHPISSWENIDISHHPIESRGLLHCEMEVPGLEGPVHCINVHLGLWATEPALPARVALRAASARRCPTHAPLIVAGDFNDWRGVASDYSPASWASRRCSSARQGRHARSFPARLPLLALDRIYVRDLKVGATQRLAGGPWSRLSDHAALAARVSR